MKVKPKEKVVCCNVKEMVWNSTARNFLTISIHNYKGELVNYNYKGEKTESTMQGSSHKRNQEPFPNFSLSKCKKEA